MRKQIDFVSDGAAKVIERLANVGGTMPSCQLMTEQV